MISWTKIIKTSNWGWGFLASSMTIITSCTNTKEEIKNMLMCLNHWCGDNYDTIIDCAFCISLICLFVIILWEILLLFRKYLGTHWIPISFKVLYKYLILSTKKEKYKDFETAICRFSDEAIRNVLEKNDINGFKNALVEFLDSVGKNLKERYKVDFSISYKSFAEEGKDNYLLLPEASYCSYQPKEHLYRYNDLVYSLNSNDNKGKISDYICTAQEQNKPDGTKDRRIGNNIFIYLFRNTETEYMTNDLEKEEKKGNFFTGSLNYPLFYKSMAVFSLEKPGKKNKKKGNALLGFLVIDSPQKGVFVEKEFKKVGDLLKNNILKIYDKYEK